jgi:glycosyltransferase involved in cell wall biosynthesis
MRAEVARRGLEESVELLGWITGAQKMAAFTAADVFCLPSHSEGLPITIIEAMSAGLPVIATRISGIPEEVAEGETGLLYALGDLDGLAESITRLLSWPALRARMGAAGRRRVERVFDRDVVAGQLVGLWGSL